MKAIFSNPGKLLDRKRHYVMGTASSAFQNDTLGFNTSMAIKLSCYIFGNLDRQAIAGMERSLNISAPYRRNVRRLVAQMSENSLSLNEILKPLKNRKDHHVAYLIFDSICAMTANSQRFDMSFMKKVISVGKAMGLAKNEIYRLVEKNGLAA